MLDVEPVVVPAEVRVPRREVRGLVVGGRRRGGDPDRLRGEDATQDAQDQRVDEGPPAGRGPDLSPAPGTQVGPRPARHPCSELSREIRFAIPARRHRALTPTPFARWLTDAWDHRT